MSPRRRPPALAGWLLDRLDPSGSIRGDLDEEYLRYRRPEGAVGARLWYWGQVVRSLPRMTGRREGEGAGAWAARRGADLGQALRAVRRRPGASGLTVATLGLALGVNVAVFSLVQAVVFRDLPFEAASRLVRLHPDELFYVDLAGAQALAEEASTVERVLPWGRTLFTFTGSDPAEEVRGATVAWDHFEGLGARPLLGRGFVRGDAEVVPADAVVLSHGLWVRRFGADPGVVGRRVEVGERPRTVVGVMGPDHVPMEPDWEAWSPMPLDAEAFAGRALAVNALLRPGVTQDEARDDLRRALVAAWARGGYTATDDDVAAIRVVPLRDHLLGDVGRPLGVLYAAVLAVLLLACANVANLRLAQGESRAPEMAVRASLGAGRGRLVGQLVLESLVLAAVGGALALGLAGALHAWGAGRLPAGMPRASQWTLGGATVAYAVASAAGAGLLAGLLPAWRLAGGRGLARRARGAGPGAERLSALLVTAEVAGSVVLLVAAGLMLRSFAALRAVDPGFETDGVVAVRVTPTSDRVAGPAETAAYWDAVLEAAGAVPGVEARGAIMFLPMSPGGAWSAVRREGSSVPDDEVPSGSFRIVTPGYFETLGVRRLAGRLFEAGDDAGGEPVAVINESLARLVFGDDDPVGRTLLVGRDEPDPLRVVGVVADVRQSQVRDEAFPEFYRPAAQEPFARMYLVARSGGGDPGATLAGLQGAVKSVDAGAILSRPVTLDALVAESVGATRLVTQLLALFGVVALTLGAVGVYGVTASAVARRRREIGIRKALGAPAGAVAGGTLIRALVPVFGGLLLGAVGAAAASGLLDTLLFEVDARDPVTFVVVPVVLGLVALAAVAGPTLRASRIDPVRTLRP